MVNGSQSGSGTERNGNGMVPLGYYLVGTSMGTLAALDTTNRTVDIYEKNDEPEIEKKVLKKGAATQAGTATYAHLVNDKDGTNSWQENTDADINDLVMFRTVVTAQQGAKGYVLHDAMEKGLELVHQTYAAKDATTDATKPVGTAEDRYGMPGTVPAGFYNVKVYLVKGTDADSASRKVYVVDNKASKTISGTSRDFVNWRLKYSGAEVPEHELGSDGCDFEVEFFDADGTNAESEPRANEYDVTFLAYESGADASTADFVEVKDGDRIVVTYWARLTKDAFVYDEGGEQLSPDYTTSGSNPNTVVTTNADGANIAGGTANGKTLDGKQVKQTRNTDDRNTNSTILTYGARSFTKWDDATVTTYQFDVAKTRAESMDGDPDDSFSLLAGAQFKLYKAVPSGTFGATSFQPQGSADTYYYLASNPLKFVKAPSDETAATHAAEVDAIHSTLNPSYSSSHVMYRLDGDTATSATSGATDVIESEETKAVHLYGLEKGDYVLVEVKAPTGYNKLAHPIVVHVNGDENFDGANGTGENEGKINTLFFPNDAVSSYSQTAADWMSTVSAVTSFGPSDASGQYKSPLVSAADPNPATANGGVHVVNNTGQELPSTGGIGTTIFYVAGTVLVVGAVVMLVAKRRMGEEA